jgi:molybdopterin molybdotransferase
VITPDDALARLLALAAPVEIETLPLIEAAGRWAAEAVLATRTQPARDLSAMDGYAIRHADMPGPWRVAGESAAGSPCAGTVSTGEAVRIFTGAALPEGADTVIIQEDVTRTGDTMILTGDGPPAPSTHIRRAGSDFAAGQVLIEAGTLLTPARIGLAAIGGHATLPVRRSIRVALISTGDELAPVGSDPDPNRIPASNAIMLRAMLAALPVEITDFGIVPDDRAALATTFTKAAADHDILVTTGGASVGDHDLVQPALIDAGATIDFWKIAMRPGKPLMAGRLDKAIALGLPGNPVSAFVTATLFLKPLIAHLSGASDPAPPTITARLAADLPAVGPRTDYVRAHWSGGTIAPLSGDSGMLVPLAAATALLVRLAGSPPARKGDDVTVIILA